MNKEAIKKSIRDLGDLRQEILSMVGGRKKY